MLTINVITLKIQKDKSVMIGVKQVKSLLHKFSTQISTWTDNHYLYNIAAPAPLTMRVIKHE